MKRTALVLASLGFSTFAFAALTAASSPSEVTIPQLPGGFSVGGSLLFLQPSITNGDLDYASDSPLAVSKGAQFASPSIKQIEPGYDFGWGVNVGYEFPNTGNDINLSYQHLDATSHDSAFANTGDTGTVGTLGPLHFPFFRIGNNPFYSYATAKANIEWNQVDLAVGQMINVGTRLNLHPNAGISYVDIKRTMDTTFYRRIPQIQPGFNVIESQSDRSHYWGVGPIVGLDASYYLGAGLGIVTHLQGGILAGDINDKATDQFQLLPFNPANQPSFLQFNTSNNLRLVPTYTAKAGADFTYHFNNSFASYLTAEAGYQVNEYFNAIDSIYASNNGTTATGIASRQTANLYLDGPYANITVHL